jgi:hypothetical protein
MPQVGFEPMIPVFERVKTVQALYSSATLIGSYIRSYVVYFITLPILKNIESNDRNTSK